MGCNLFSSFLLPDDVCITSIWFFMHIIKLLKKGGKVRFFFKKKKRYSDVLISPLVTQWYINRILLFEPLHYYARNINELFYVSLLWIYISFDFFLFRFLSTGWPANSFGLSRKWSSASSKWRTTHGDSSTHRGYILGSLFVLNKN